jgi:glycosyltransferase involved in cell wall biosynthesis
LCSLLCDDWINNDIRISVVHKPNGGLSDARNAGMQMAAGEYISFVDSDDYVSDDFFDKLISAIHNEKSDIVECGVVRFDKNNHFDDFDDDLQINSYSNEKALSGLIAENPFHQHVWNKLYKTEIVCDTYFPVGKLNEDEFWTYQIFGQAKRVSKINKSMYYYFQRRTSIMGEGFNLRRLDALEGKANRQEYINQFFPYLSLQAKIDFYGSCMFSYQSVLKYMSGDDKRKALRIIKRYRRKCDLTFDEIKTVSGSFQKYLYFSKISFYICCKFRATAGVGF